MVGTGPAQEELEGLAERLGIAGRVTWLGALPRRRVDEVWPRFDCVVLPSRTAPHWIERMPRAAIEAMANGVPVVASTAGALPEIVGTGGRHRPRGKRGRHHRRAAAAARRPGRARPPRRRGRQRVMSEFTDAAIAGKTLRFWRDTIGATT